MTGFGGQVSPPLNAPPAEPLTVGIAPGPTSLVTTSNRVIIFGASGGTFVYNPAPAANQLSATITGQSGTDPFGNHYLAGETSYSTSAPWVATSVTPTGLQSFTSSVLGQNGTWTSNGQIAFRSASSPQLVLPSGFTGTIAASASDSSRLSATTTSFTNITKQWDMPANDAAANTVYRMTVWGTGTQGATSNAFTWQLNIGSANVVVVTISAGWAINTGANMYLQMLFQCTAAGVSGNFNAAGFWSLIDTNGNGISTGTLLDFTNTINTTVDNKVVMQWEWATVTNAPSFTGSGSLFERISG